MSKSVSERRNAAATGVTKKIAIVPRAGATSHQAGLAGRRGTLALPLAEPAALFQDRVGILVERRERRVEREITPHRRLAVLRDARRDALPFRDLRRGPHRPELDPEGRGTRLPDEAALLPRRPARRKVARQGAEPELLSGGGQILDESPRDVLTRRAAVEHEAGAARERHARVLIPGRGHGRRRPAVLELGGKAAGELAQVPRAGQVEGEEACREILVDVRHAGI